MSHADDVPPRWSLEQVLAIAPARTGAARPLAVPSLWSGTGSDDRAVWGRHVGGRSEPYLVMVDRESAVVGRPATRCTCPSRVAPCKHAIALLVLWAEGGVPSAVAPATVTDWIASRTWAGGDGAPAQRDTTVGAWPGPTADTGVSGDTADTAVTADADTDAGTDADTGDDAAGAAHPADPPDTLSVSDERLRRLESGLLELERWIDDRLRVGLGDPSIARYATWDDLALRLVDAQAGGLANRVRRVAGHVGIGSDWHSHVLAELGVLHILARAGRRLRLLDRSERDAVSAALGVAVRQADVRAQVPDTATWAVMGQSDTVEDRIVVRRTWLRHVAPRSVGSRHHGWAMLLSFAAYGDALESPVGVGSVLTADLHRYPGAVGLRALLGVVHDHDAQQVATSAVVSASPSLAAARSEVGAMLADEPWLERVPICVTAAPTVVGGSWALTDRSGSVPVLDAGDLPVLLAASAGRPVTLTAEWTPLGVVPLSVHLDDRVLELADRSAAEARR